MYNCQSVTPQWWTIAEQGQCSRPYTSVPEDQVFTIGRWYRETWLCVQILGKDIGQGAPLCKM